MYIEVQKCLKKEYVSFFHATTSTLLSNLTIRVPRAFDSQLFCLSPGTTTMIGVKGKKDRDRKVMNSPWSCCPSFLDRTKVLTFHSRASLILMGPLALAIIGVNFFRKMCMPKSMYSLTFHLHSSMSLHLIWRRYFPPFLVDTTLSNCLLNLCSLVSPLNFLTFPFVV